MAGALAAETQVGVGANLALGDDNGTQAQADAQMQVQAQDQMQEQEHMQDEEHMQMQAQAQGQEQVTIDADQLKLRLQDQDMEQMHDENRSGEQNGSQRLAFETGLHMAINQVQNTQAKVVVEQNMERFMEQYQERMNHMEFQEVSVNASTGEMHVEAQEQVRFLGFIKGKAKTSITVDSQGQVEEHTPWYGFLYAKA